MDEGYDYNDPTVPESLKEVWRWKEACYAKHRDAVDNKEYSKRVAESANRMLKKWGIELRRHKPSGSAQFHPPPKENDDLPESMRKAHS